MLTRFTLTQNQIDSIKSQIARKENILEEDISNAEVFDYLKRVSEDNLDDKVKVYKLGKYIIDIPQTLEEVCDDYTPWW